jgi:hypothetical protein
MEEREEERKTSLSKEFCRTGDVACGDASMKP